MPDALTDLRDARAAVSAALDAFSPDALGWRPAPDAWSAADVLEHLVKTERGYLRGLGRQLSAGDARRDVGAPTPQAFAQLSAFLRSDRKTRVPQAAARFVGPTGSADYDETRALWDGLDGAWRDQLTSVPDGLRDVGLVNHPVAGPLTAEGAARFCADHARHHLHQLNRLREADGFPGT